jgi:hypothetical protein
MPQGWSAGATLAAARANGGWSAGLLLVHVIACNSLNTLDIEGMGCPYVVLALGAQRKQTAARAGPNPVYDTVFPMLVVNPEFERLRLSVHDPALAAGALLGELTFNVVDIITSNEMVGSFRLNYTPSGTVELKLSFHFVAPQAAGRQRINIPNTLEFAYDADVRGTAPTSATPSARSAASSPMTAARRRSDPASPAAQGAAGAAVSIVPRITPASLLQHAATAANDPIVDGIFLGITGLYQRMFGPRGRMVGNAGEEDEEDEEAEEAGASGSGRRRTTRGGASPAAAAAAADDGEERAPQGDDDDHDDDNEIEM